MALKYDWLRDADGLVSFNPYVGYQTATLDEKIVLLQLRFVSSPDQPDDEAHALQLALSRDQAREFG